MLAAEPQLRQLDAELPHIEAGEETFAELFRLVRAHALILARECWGAVELRLSARPRVECELFESVVAKPAKLPPQLGSQGGLELQVAGLIERL